MSSHTPTTAEISAGIISQLEASFSTTIPLLPKAFTRVLAKVLAGVFVTLYKYAGFMTLQLFVATASMKPTTINGREVVPLVEWGRLIGVGDPAAATRAELTVQLTVQNEVGSLPSGTQLTSTANGNIYITTSAVTLNAATVLVDVRSVSDQAGGGGAGSAGNLPPGALLTFVNPPSNLSQTAVVTASVVTGANEEDVEVYRRRVVERFKKRPQGGAYSDYEMWGEEPAGILNVYPYTSDCPGQVDIYVESATEVDGIPTAAQLQEVSDSIYLNDAGLASRRPANALPNVLPIVRAIFDVEVQSLTVNDAPQVITNITAALNTYMLEREPFIRGLSVLPRKDRVTATGVAGVVSAVVDSAGGVFLSSNMKVAGLEVESYVLSPGQKAKLGTVLFT